jgi:hypothetical protein
MAGMKCTVCGHPERATVDRLLAGGNISERVIADRFGLARTSVGRHRKNHLVRAVQRELQRRQKEEEVVADAFDLRLERARAVVQRALKKAEASDDGLRLIAPLVGQLHRNFELDARVRGVLDGEGVGGRAGIHVEYLIILPSGSDDSTGVADDEPIDVTAVPVLDPHRS